MRFRLVRSFGLRRSDFETMFLSQRSSRCLSGKQHPCRSCLFRDAKRSDGRFQMRWQSKGEDSHREFVAEGKRQCRFEAHRQFLF